MLLSAIIVFIVAAAWHVSAFAGVTADRQPLIGLNFYSRSAPVDTSRVRILVDGKDVTAGASIDQWKITYRPPEPLAPGRHTAKVVVFDMNGSSAIKKWSFTIDPDASDTKPPLIKFVSPTPGNGGFLAAVGSNIAIAAEISDGGGSGVEPKSVSLSVSRNGSPFGGFGPYKTSQNNIYLWKIPAAPDGRYVVSVSASDKNGNASDIVSTAFTIDGTAPVITNISASPAEIDNNGTVKIAFNVDDVPEANVNFCKVAVKGFSSTMTKELRPTAQGRNVVRIRAKELGARGGRFEASVTCTDNAGNVATSERNAAFSITTPGELLAVIESPELRDTSAFSIDPLPRCTNMTSLQIDGRAPADETILLLVNGAESRRDVSMPDGTFSFDSIQLSNGYNDIAAAIENEDGTTGILTDEQTVIVDIDAPVVIPQFPAQGEEISGDDDHFIFDYSDSGDCGIDTGSITLVIDNGNVRCDLDAGDTSATCIPDEPLDAGTHSIEAHAADSAGNTAVNKWTFSVRAPAVDDNPDGILTDNPDDSPAGDPGNDGQGDSDQAGDDQGGKPVDTPVDQPGGDAPADEPVVEPGDEPDAAPLEDIIDIELYVHIEKPKDGFSFKDIPIVAGGTAPAGATVILYINGSRFIDVVADAGNKYSFDLDDISTFVLPDATISFKVVVEYNGEVMESGPVVINLKNVR